MARRRPAEVGVELGGHQPRVRPPAGPDAEAPPPWLDRTLRGGRDEPPGRLGHGLGEVAVARPEPLHVEAEVAQDLLDRVAPHPVVERERPAAIGREPVLLDPELIERRHRLVLHVALRQRPDRRGAEADQCVGRIHRVALEVAPQRARLARPRQRVVGPGEVVDADAGVARRNEQLLRQRELPLDMEIEVSLEDTEISIDLASDALSQQKLDLNTDSELGAENDDEEKDRKKTKPQIYLLSSGEITPEFDIRFYILGIETSYFVRGFFDGSLKTEISDL